MPPLSQPPLPVHRHSRVSHTCNFGATITTRKMVLPVALVLPTAPPWGVLLRLARRLPVGVLLRRSHAHTLSNNETTKAQIIASGFVGQTKTGPPLNRIARPAGIGQAHPPGRKHWFEPDDTGLEPKWLRSSSQLQNGPHAKKRNPKMQHNGQRSGLQNPRMPKHAKQCEARFFACSCVLGFCNPFLRPLF